MNFISTIKLVFRTLLARKGRSFLTILGIVIGVAGVIIIIALGAGAQSLVLGQITKLGSNLLSVQPGKSNEKGPPSQIFGIVVTTLTKDDAEALRDSGRLPDIEAVGAMVRGTATVTWTNQAVDTNFTGTQYTYSQLTNFTMQEGEFFDEQQERGNANVVVLGSSVAEDLFGQSGQSPLGQVVKVKSASQKEPGGVPLRVIGVISPRGTAAFQNQDDQIFIPLEIAQKQLLGIGYLQMINIKVNSPDNLNSTRDQIKQVLNERHRVKSDEQADYTVRNLADAIALLSTITNALQLFLTAMASIALVVGGIGILNIMMVTVTDAFATILSEARKYELGLIMAHQYIGQLVGKTEAYGQSSTKMRDAVFGNVGTIMSFKIGAEDAEYMAKEMAPVLSEQDVIGIPNFNCYTKLNINNTTSRPFSMATIYDESNRNEKLSALIKEYSRMKYGRKKVFVNQEIEDRIGIVRPESLGSVPPLPPEMPAM
jgi:putative ABC transport system permease protein